MENQKVIAMIIAALALILVIIAGKSCTANVNNEKKTPSSSGETAPQISISIVQHTAQNNNNTTDSENASDDQDVSSEKSTSPEIQYVTDLLGRVIGTEVHPVTEGTTETPTHIEYVTDLLGRVVRTEIVTGEEETSAETTMKKSSSADNK